MSTLNLTVTLLFVAASLALIVRRLTFIRYVWKGRNDKPWLRQSRTRLFFVHGAGFTSCSMFAAICWLVYSGRVEWVELNRIASGVGTMIFAILAVLEMSMFMMIRGRIHDIEQQRF